MSNVALDKLSFLHKYQFLVEVDPNVYLGLYRGIFRIKIILPSFPQATGIGISIFKNSNLVQLEKMPKTTDLLTYMDSLLQFLNQQESQTAETIPDVGYFLDILCQLERIKTDHKCKILATKNLSSLKLFGLKQNDHHRLEMNRTSGAEYIVISHSLPELGSSGVLFKWQATPESHTIAFVQLLEQLDEFYANLHKIDELCHVVDPSEIDSRTSWRTIKFSSKVFLKITLHPLQPSSVVIGFIGPTKETEYLRELYDSKIENWDPESDVYTNLLRIFEIMSFPMRIQDNEHEESTVSCGICMSHRNDHNQIPIVSCDNEKCSLIFHVECLKQWFLSLKQSKTFFAISIGTCPYCKQKVSSSFDEFLSNVM
ncbi:E3 ubiquitin-protein ligase FANCL [Sabethes cyaneus]|uniref:E3 ubiquitin-protein ligase FANCL n=1 Tax=Sabethes cyaneus TaxID=53552 RepID=UPI00237EE1C7|nr:E3 ubiquitin-protein ligase FANCL [Sabethes cyaneus]